MRATQRVNRPQGAPCAGTPERVGLWARIVPGFHTLMPSNGGTGRVMRQVIHGLVSILLWIVFFYYWFLVTHQSAGAGVLLAVKVLAVLVLVGVVATILWVRHNERLARRDRRHEPRTSPPEVLDTDHVGRRVASPGLEDLRRAKVTEVSIGRDDVKSYDVTREGE